MHQTERIRNLMIEAYRIAEESQSNCYVKVYDDGDIPANIPQARSLAAFSVARFAEAASLYYADPDIDDEMIPKLLTQFRRIIREYILVFEENNKDLTGLYIEIDALKRLLSNSGYLD